MTACYCRCTVATLLWACCLAAAAQTDDQPKFQMSAAESQLLEMTNRERQKAGVPPLRPNPALFRAARAHSANMARQGKMEHVLDGKDPFRRMVEAGYRLGFGGENIAFGFADLGEVMRVWMNSPGHRQNILSPNYTEIGLGRAVDAAGVPYYTQVFASPAPARPWD